MREGGGKTMREGGGNTRDGVAVREAWQGVVAREGGYSGEVARQRDGERGSMRGEEKGRGSTYHGCMQGCDTR